MAKPVGFLLRIQQISKLVSATLAITIARGEKTG